MAKRFYDSMVRSACKSLADVSFEVLSAEKAEKIDTDTKEIRKYTKFEVEVPRNVKQFARTRFSVKILDPGDLPVTDAEIEERNYFVTFRNLSITFISSTRDVYFSADSFQIEAEASFDADDSY